MVNKWDNSGLMLDLRGPGFRHSRESLESFIIAAHTGATAKKETLSP